MIDSLQAAPVRPLSPVGPRQRPDQLFQPQPQRTWASPRHGPLPRKLRLYRDLPQLLLSRSRGRPRRKLGKDGHDLVGEALRKQEHEGSLKEQDRSSPILDAPFGWLAQLGRTGRPSTPAASGRQDLEAPPSPRQAPARESGIAWMVGEGAFHSFCRARHDGIRLPPFLSLRNPRPQAAPAAAAVVSRLFLDTAPADWPRREGAVVRLMLRNVLHAMGRFSSVGRSLVEATALLAGRTAVAGCYLGSNGKLHGVLAMGSIFRGHGPYPLVSM